TTVFLSSHLLHEVELVCDRVAVLDHGRLVAEGPVQDLLRGPQSVRVRVPSPVDAARALADLPGVERIEPNGCYVHVAGVTSEEVIVHLVERRIVPSEVTSGGADLESVFLSLTQSTA
ncbi:MAG TPA: ABC transporter ATP-binding protein, partial [Thermoleophilia bacterium]|nr:ABC transporter ATP-binding protein [Thermoleophilia bacterium]